MADALGAALRGASSGPKRGAWKGRSERGGQHQGNSRRANTGLVKERPTHFISVPLHQLKGFTSRVANMTNALLAASPPITGLDPSIVISPPRLHLTLGVMSLSEARPDENLVTAQENSVEQTSTNDDPQNEEQLTPRKTISEAVEFLKSLKPEIREILQDQPLRLVLDEIAVMRRSRSGEADVMYLGPSNTTTKTEEHAQTFKALQTIHDRFREAGFVTETRPLKLHCTVLNTSHRKTGGRSGPRGVPFSMAEIDATMAKSPEIVGQLLSSSQPLSVRKLNLCCMGSYDNLGRYVSVGSVEW